MQHSCPHKSAQVKFPYVYAQVRQCIYVCIIHVLKNMHRKAVFLYMQHSCPDKSAQVKCLYKSSVHVMMNDSVFIHVSFMD